MLPSELEEPEYTVQSIIQEAEEMRAILKDIETKGREIMHRHRDAAGINDSWDEWEVRASSMIALRHIEDARMRYGKVIQYAGNGESLPEVEK